MSANSSAPATRSVFARRLKQLRGPRGFPTARSFAQALEIDENRYTRYERAEVEPDLTLIVKICKLLRCTANDLLETGPTTTGGFADGAVPYDGQGALTPRRALAWQLATELAAIDGHDGDPSIDGLARTSRLFAEIDADTFSFVSHMAADPRLRALEAAKAERIGVIAGQLMSALNADILGCGDRT